MKVILLKDVGGVGRRFEVKDVSDGFARNQLIPRGLAEPAAPGSIATLAARKERKNDEKRLGAELLAKNISALNGKTVTIVRKVNERGHLFAKIKPEEITRAIMENLRANIPESVIPVKYVDTAGTHTLVLVCDGVRAHFTLEVRPEGQ